MINTEGNRDEEEGIILHRDGIIIDLDEVTAAMLGSPRGDLIGARLHEILPKIDILGVPASLLRHTSHLDQGRPE